MTRAGISFYFDCEAALAEADWRAQIAWPRRLTETDTESRAAWTGFWRLIRGLDGLARDCLLLAGGRLFAQCLALAEAASVVQSARERNFLLQGGPPAVRFLASEWIDEMPPDVLAASAFKNPAKPSFTFVRRLARGLALTPPRSWLRMLISPQAIALSHNSLMHAYAAAQGSAVGFCHGEELLRIARKKNESLAQPDFSFELARRVGEVFLAGRNLGTPYRERFTMMAQPFVQTGLALAAADIFGIRQVASLPDDIWIGGSGYYPTRLAAQEVMRRGGSVTSFEHGWGSACESVVEVLAFGDLAFANRYVAYTDVGAEKFRHGPVRSIALPDKETCYIGGHGNPDTRRLLLHRTGKMVNRKPRVVYAPTITAGFRQMTPPLLPDPIYLDWQFRICEALVDFPIDFVSRPHPEGYFRNSTHPLASLSHFSAKPFENLIAETDIFIFDFRQSTTFGHALCSDRPIVLLDFGIKAFDAETEAAIRRRCRVIDVNFDEANRPKLPLRQLREAVLSVEREPLDPSYFHDLIIGPRKVT